MAGQRSEARRYAVLALYQWQLGGEKPAEIARQFFDDPAWIDALAEGLNEDQTPPRDGAAAPLRRYDMQLFDALLRGVTGQAEAIDEALGEHLDRSPQSLDPVERAILRVGTYELLYSPALPVRVVINEAVELAKVFGAEQGHRYVNAVLDRVARRARADELAGRPPA